MKVVKVAKGGEGGEGGEGGSSLPLPVVYLAASCRPRALFLSRTWNSGHTVVEDGQFLMLARTSSVSSSSWRSTCW